MTDLKTQKEVLLYIYNIAYHWLLLITVF